MKDKVLCVIREPFIDKIPSLKSMLTLLSNANIKIDILSAKNDTYSNPTFLINDMDMHLIPEKNDGELIPTSLRLLFKQLSLSFNLRTSTIIGAGKFGMIFSFFPAKILKKKFIAFCVEFPQITTPMHTKLSWLEKLENFIIRNADFVITHDEYHSSFLQKHLNVSPSKILLLANGTIGKAKNIQTNFLHQRLSINPDNLIILHSGGLGPFFRCDELAKSVKNWKENWKLVFHMSHIVSNDAYANKLMNKANHTKVLFSTKPVATNELDTLVSSATIGIALYSLEILGYRGEYMGLAAGKIGNYLKCGLPVIATKIDSLLYIEKYHCGILIENESEISDAISKIIDNYETYRLNANKCYNEIWNPENYMNSIIKAIRS